MSRELFLRTERGREHCRKIASLGGKAGVGWKHSEKAKKKISLANKGCVPWNKGVPQPWSEARRNAQQFVKHKSNKKPISKKPIRMNGKEYDPNWHEIRKKIYERDLWTCQECNIKCHGRGTKNKIQCHHIDFDPLNNESSNLITLCASCHMKTNFNRVNWIEHYQDKLRKANKISHANITNHRIL